MDVTNATIEWIGEIETHNKKDRSTTLKVAIDVSTNSTPKKRYVIFQNQKNYSFDLIKNFKANLYKVGDYIDFDYNEPTGNYFPIIWRIVNHRSNSAITKIIEKAEVKPELVKKVKPLLMMEINCPHCNHLIKYESN